MRSFTSSLQRRLQTVIYASHRMFRSIGRSEQRTQHQRNPQLNWYTTHSYRQAFSCPSSNNEQVTTCCSMAMLASRWSDVGSAGPLPAHPHEGCTRCTSNVVNACASCTIALRSMAGWHSKQNMEFASNSSSAAMIDPIPLSTLLWLCSSIHTP